MKEKGGTRAHAARFSHLGEGAGARMVDTGAKAVTLRSARAEAVVFLGASIARRLARKGGLAKGGVCEVARVAGILAAKRTAELIPLCHPLPLDHVEVTCALGRDRLTLAASARCRGRTGVEMEALVAAAVAALTVYDMCKSAGKGILIERVRLLEKTGGKSGEWRAPRTPGGRS